MDFSSPPRSNGALAIIQRGFFLFKTAVLSWTSECLPGPATARAAASAIAAFARRTSARVSAPLFRLRYHFCVFGGLPTDRRCSFCDIIDGRTGKGLSDGHTPSVDVRASSPSFYGSNLNFIVLTFKVDAVKFNPAGNQIISYVYYVYHFG
jgi:hypothetical protein